MECGDSPQTLRADNAGAYHEKHLTDSMVSCLHSPKAICGIDEPAAATIGKVSISKAKSL
jgi:hypothetical protein